jgi:transcriptional regulator of arginine metabolism
MWRHDLADLVLHGSYRTQDDLVQALAGRGHEITQASVSRELRALGVQKLGGVYVMASNEDLGAPVVSAQIAASSSLCVLKTIPAHAGVLAQYVDRLALPGVLGTIAGDDTVFVALLDGPSGQALLDDLRRR